jgi:hypothetical protein
VSSAAQPSSDASSEKRAEQPGVPPEPKRPPERALGQTLREPLLHFLMLGLLLFAADRLLRPAQTALHRIEATPEVIAQLSHDFRERLAREPTTEELRMLRQEWIAKEVLFREGVKLGLDTGDPIVRSRVAQRMRGVLEQLVQVGEPMDAELEAWFQANSNRYRTRRRFTFTHVYATGAQGRERAEAFAKQLREQASAELVPALGDPFEFPKTVSGRGEPELRSIFGDHFVERLATAARDEWTVLESKHGWHAVLSSSVTGGQAKFSEIKPSLVKDFKDAQRVRLVNARIDELVHHYQVE